MTKNAVYEGAPRAVLTVGAAGAIIGGAVSAARNIGRVKDGEMTGADAAREALREAGTTGTSTAAATAVVGALKLGGLTSLLGVVGVAVGTKYLLDKAIDSRLCKAGEQVRLAPVEETPAPAEKPSATGTTPTKTATKKTAAKSTASKTASKPKAGKSTTAKATTSRSTSARKADSDSAE